MAKLLVFLTCCVNKEVNMSGGYRRGVNHSDAGLRSIRGEKITSHFTHTHRHTRTHITSIYSDNDNR